MVEYFPMPVRPRPAPSSVDLGNKGLLRRPEEALSKPKACMVDFEFRFRNRRIKRRESWQSLILGNRQQACALAIWSNYGWTEHLLWVKSAANEANDRAKRRDWSTSSQFEITGRQVEEFPSKGVATHRFRAAGFSIPSFPSRLSTARPSHIN